MVYAIIPAAGIGSRMQSSIPKQYLPLLAGNVLLYSVRALLVLPDIRRLIIALHPSDQWWQETAGMLSAEERSRIRTCIGGAERWQSVQAALRALRDEAAAEDWVLVHDAVRPCVRREDLESLLTVCLSDSGVPGALLASPVSDTVKRADASLQVVATVDRSQLWAACTPQMFPLAALQHALEQAQATGVTVTDEASAMESIGVHPRLVPCAKDNIKITWPDDLNLAALILQSRQRETLYQSDT